MQIPIHSKLAKARRVPFTVPGILRDREGRTTFVPADEALAPFDLEPGAAAHLPRDVLLLARATRKRVQVSTDDGRRVVAELFELYEARAAKLEGHFTGIIDLIDDAPYVRDITSGHLHALRREVALAQGTVVAGHVDLAGLPARNVVIDDVVAQAGSAEARSWSIAASLKLEPVFPTDAAAEAKAINASLGLDDPSLVDRRGEPFFAIDNHGSRDIDQAMRLARRPSTGARQSEAAPGLVPGRSAITPGTSPGAASERSGWTLQYALADMAHAVKPGTALWNEAMHRGASFYLPGINVPMQPRDVCEHAVSLNAHEDHRAVVVTFELDDNGVVEKRWSERALIRSRAQLTYPSVTAHLEGKTPLAVDDHGKPVPPDVVEQIAIFRELGSVLQKRARQRGVVDPARRELRIGLDGDRFFLHEVEDDLASGLNAQLSILANVGAASMLVDTGIEGIEAPGIFRIHPAPTRDDLAGLRRRISAIVDGNEVHASWKWRANEELADWVERVRALPTNDRERALSTALQVQVLGVQVSSEYTREPGLHSGLMVSGYGRFTAPMREVVGLLSHAVLVQLDALKRVHALGVLAAPALSLLWDHMVVGAVVDAKELSPARAALCARAVALEPLRDVALHMAATALLAELTPLEQRDFDAAHDAFDDAVLVGNESRIKQKKCEAAALRLLFDDLFMSDLGGIAAGNNASAPVRTGTVMSVALGKMTVLLARPDVEVRLAYDDLGDDFALARDGTELSFRSDGVKGVKRRVLIGASVQIKATHHDGDKLHFTLV